MVKKRSKYNPLNEGGGMYPSVKKVAVAENYKYLLSSVIKKAAFYNMDPYLSFSLSNKLEEPDIFNTERSNG